MRSAQRLDAYVYEALRTPRGAGKETGALHGVKPVELLAPLYAALKGRSPAAAERVEDVVLGCSVQTGEQGSNLAKISSLAAGFSERCSGVTLNRFCASGLDALSYAALKVSSGMEDWVLAGGVESMSRVSLFADNGPWFSDPEVAARTRFVHMGVAADLVAALDRISRTACDTYAAQSQARAAAAGAEGHLPGPSVVPVLGREGQVLLKRDECVRPDTTPQKLAALPPAFGALNAAALDQVQRQYPQLSALPAVHHAGSSPARADGAALALIGHARAGEMLGLKPRARLLSYANVATEPLAMLRGMAPATEKALRQAGMALQDVDLFEANESFAAPVVSFIRALSLDEQRVNVWGGAIALGHPLGATGGVLLATLLDALERRDRSVGVLTVCAGAGIAQALVIERS